MYKFLELNTFKTLKKVVTNEIYTKTAVYLQFYYAVLNKFQINFITTKLLLSVYIKLKQGV